MNAGKHVVSGISAVSFPGSERPVLVFIPVSNRAFPVGHTPKTYGNGLGSTIPNLLSLYLVPAGIAACTKQWLQEAFFKEYSDRFIFYSDIVSSKYKNWHRHVSAMAVRQNIRL